MSNFGVLGNLRIDGRRIFVPEKRDGAADKGSIIMIIGTDLPLSDRQLRRAAKRAAASLGRVGSYLGTGSGDIAIAFSNGNIVPHYSDTKVLPCGYLFENDMDTVFEATVEVVEESIISSPVSCRVYDRNQRKNCSRLKRLFAKIRNLSKSGVCLSSGCGLYAALRT